MRILGSSRSSNARRHSNYSGSRRRSHHRRLFTAATSVQLQRAASVFYCFGSTTAATAASNFGAGTSFLVPPLLSSSSLPQPTSSPPQRPFSLLDLKNCHSTTNNSSHFPRHQRLLQPNNYNNNDIPKRYYHSREDKTRNIVTSTRIGSGVTTRAWIPNSSIGIMTMIQQLRGGGGSSSVVGGSSKASFSTLSSEVSSTSDINGIKNPKCIYLDYNGTTPIHKRVLDAMTPFLTTQFGNPSSSHYFGQAPKIAIQKARTSILSLLYSKETIQQFRDSSQLLKQHHDGIIFCGCGTEADNLAIHLALEANRHRFMTDGGSSNNGDDDRHRRPHIITSNVEHPAITEYLKALENDGTVRVTYVPVNEEGIVNVHDVMEAIDSDTVLVTLMIANNESGAIQPIQKVSQCCKSHGVLFHTDAAQAVGKLSLRIDNDSSEDGIGDGIDMITIVGHKFEAPKGIACLYVKPGCFESNAIEPKRYMLLGGGQEGGKRSGTENVPYIVGMGTAIDILMEEVEAKPEAAATTPNEEQQYRWQRNASEMESMRDRLYQGLKDGLGDDDDIVRNNGPNESKNRLPNTLNVGLKGINAGILLNNIQDQVACSAGSACHATGVTSISPVLSAMNVPLEYANGTLRLSVGPSTTSEEIDTAINIIVKEVKRQLE